MKPDLQLIVSQAEAEFKSANSLHDLDNAKSLFLGKNGKDLLEQALKEWEFEYIKKNSLTNTDSFLIKIKNIKKINE